MTVQTTVSLAVALFATACAQVPTPNVGAIEQQPGPAREALSQPAAMPAPTPLPEKVALPAPQPVIVTVREPVVDEPPAEPARVHTVWDRIRKGFRMPDLDSPLVREWETWYSTRPDYVARMIERSSRYLFHVIEEVERRGMPSEIALLPMIESAYNPVAYSRSHASGIWQFIPSTGKLYGLRQNWWYDGRRDIVAATGAALDYLEKLYGMFGSWDLALASYNWGEGAVGRAIARNEARGLPGDYANLTMPAETRGYVPKLIAVKNIIANPARFGLTIADVPNEPYFATVPVKRHIDVKLAAKLAEMPLEEFKFLNPAHNKPVIKRGAAETIVLPKHKVQLFLANLQSHDKPLVSWQAHTVKPGERPEKIAARYGVTLTELKDINGISDRRKITSGVPLLVPVVNAEAEPHLPDLPAAPITLAKAVKEARTAPAAKPGRQAAGHLQRVQVVKRNGTKTTRVTERPAPAQRVKVAIKKQLPAARQVVVKSKPATPPQASSKKVLVAENRKDR